jgi:hypothetical protein
MIATATIVFTVLALFTLGNGTQIIIDSIDVALPKVAKAGIQSLSVSCAILLTVLHKALPD